MHQTWKNAVLSPPTYMCPYRPLATAKEKTQNHLKEMHAAHVQMRGRPSPLIEGTFWSHVHRCLSGAGEFSET